MASERVLAEVLVEQRPTPAPQRMHGGLQLATASGETEEGGGHGGRRLLTLDDSGPLEVAQALGEQVGRDAGEAVAEVGVPAAVSQQQLANDQHGPAVADDVQRLRDAAVLAVGAHGP